MMWFLEVLLAMLAWTLVELFVPMLSSQMFPEAKYSLYFVDIAFRAFKLKTSCMVDCRGFIHGIKYFIDIHDIIEFVHQPNVFVEVLNCLESLSTIRAVELFPIEAQNQVLKVL
jgi:hypothetical protein